MPSINWRFVVLQLFQLMLSHGADRNSDISGTVDLSNLGVRVLYIGHPEMPNLRTKQYTGLKNALVAMCCTHGPRTNVSATTETEETGKTSLFR